MTDQTSNAKALVSAVARAFYDDISVCVVDYLLREKFLRDGKGMGKRLHLTTKQVRHTLVFLQNESIVATEDITGIVETVGSTRTGTRTYRRKRTAQFWYIDLNRAVHTIRLRLYLIKSGLEKAINDAVLTSTYVCPGYKTKTCNGLYSELEVQYFPVHTTGQFLCRECEGVHRNNPDPPPVHSYALELVDNKAELQNAEDLLRRFNAQLSSKWVENRRLRPGIYDLLKLIQDHSTPNAGATPVTSNLPSENGADKCLQDSSPDATTTFALEAAEEFAGLVYFRNPVGGEMVALDIEGGGGGARAFHLASRGGGGGPSPIITNEGCRKHETPLGIEIEPPKKLTCRQTTPFFLRDNIGRTLLERTRTLSIGSSSNISKEAVNAMDSAKPLETSLLASNFDPQIEVPVFLEQQFDLHCTWHQHGTSLQRSTSFPKNTRQISSNSFASVEWEEC